MGLKKNGFRFLVFWYFGILGHIDIYGFKLFLGLGFWYFGILGLGLVILGTKPWAWFKHLVFWSGVTLSKKLNREGF